MKKEQNAVKKLREHNGWKTDPKHLLLAMQEELGEVTASYLANHDDNYRKNSKIERHNLEEELGDLLLLIIAFANEMGINLDKSLKRHTIREKNSSQRYLENVI